MAFTQPGSPDRDRRWIPRTGWRAPLRQFLLLALVGLFALPALIVIAFDGAATEGVAAALVVYAAGVGTAAASLRRAYPHARLGLCNGVTLSRLVLVAALVAPLATGLVDPWPVLVLASVALSLDGIDGWLARRDGLASAFGARFDMEVDSALALVLALLALISGGAGPLVLVLGLPRYLFAAAGTVLPWLDRPLPDRYSRKVISVVQMATLILLQVPIVADRATAPLVAIAAAGLVWSFGRDILWLWRRRS